MSRLRFRMSMSLDGFVAGPDQSVDDPLGVGGMRLHEWAFALRAFREMHGLEGGEINESTAILEEAFANVGATVMGRNMFGGHPGPWDPARPWNGWWGANPPFHHPVFVLTHHPRQPLELEGGTTFTFVTDGIEAALKRATQAAGGKDVSLGGGANAARQYLAAGLVDEMDISLVPTLLGRGERLFEGVGDDLHGLDLVRTIAAPNVTYLKFARLSKGRGRSGFPPAGWRTVTPRIMVHDAPALVEFVKHVFEATGDFQPDRPTVLRLGDSVILVSTAGVREPMRAFLYVYVDDVDGTHRRAIWAGATSLEEPSDLPYGDRRAMVRDPWGNTWQIASPLGNS